MSSPDSSPPTEVPPSAPQAPDIPWWVRYTRWRPTSHQESVTAEKKLLALARYPLEVADVPVGSGRKDEYVHTITGGSHAAPTLVCIPGYGAGAAFFFRNLSGMADQFRVHAVDPLGTGLSGRPRFTARNREQAEDFFLNSLAEWRAKMGLGKMILLGHSMGGYLAANYALRHPDHVAHLILVCPAGVAKQPEDYIDPVTRQSPWTLRGQLARLARGLWDVGLTPGTVVRTLGPWGPGLIQKYARNRFREGPGLSPEEVTAFEEYFYHIMAASGSGEHALKHILAPFAWARHPLEHSLAQLKVPVSFIYGVSDWMDPEAGKRVCRQIREERGELSKADLQVSVIAQAGHYPFLDQPEAFLAALKQQTQQFFNSKPAATFTNAPAPSVDSESVLDSAK